ncbi:RNA-binding protein 25 isoform X2 [Cephus cinctus]|uniref:RNA-binding protein 25 isoform X2 n=1 Tax=Cephus cinctus TaxID=211228 RepID=A0AAJ7RAR5_CEPCN|nr:RNA-binding protein 25 isoform X2 [Cephus cinctus]
MTTMDSDSESQDSDEGRRFRFEATRKDATIDLHARERNSSARKSNSSRRLRSRDRSTRDRRDYDKSKYERDRREPKSSDVGRRASKDPESSEKHEKDSKCSTKSYSRDLKNSKESHDSKNTINRDNKDGKISNNQKESRDSKSKFSEKDVKSLSNRDNRDTRSRESKDSRDRDREKRRSRERSRERSHDRSSSEKYSTRNRDKVKLYSRERSGGSNQMNKNKVGSDRERFREEFDKSDKTDQKLYKKEKKAKSTKQDIYLQNKILDQIGSDSESDLGALDSDVGPILSLDKKNSKELNLSDFDIVSDTIENSSGTSGSENTAESFAMKGTSLSHEPRVKKRVSKHQYERLLKRQVTANKSHLEKIRKVNPRNGDHLPGPSNNNSSALSDFLLGSELAASTSTSALTEDRMSYKKKRRKHSKDEESAMSESELEELCLTSVDKEDGDIYGPALPPKLFKCLNRESPEEHESANKDSLVIKMDNNSIQRPKPNGSPENSESTRTIVSSISGSIGSDDLNDEGTCGPVLPGTSIKKAEPVLQPDPSRIIGPTLPPYLSKSTEDEDNLESSFGPALPPRLMQQKKGDPELENIIGPCLPNGSGSLDDGNAMETIESDSEDENMMGPLPADHPAATNSYVQQQLERRARRIKDEFREKDNDQTKKREEWMMELPPAQAVNLGLGPRKFRIRPGPDMSDRSSWTDTPMDKARKQREKVCHSRNRIIHCIPSISTYHRCVAH